MSTTERKRRPRRRWTRVLALLLVLAVAGAFFWDWQQNSIQTEPIEALSPRLPAAFSGLRIVQLSDVHGKEFGAGNEKLLAAVEAQRPDLIVITGDLIDGTEQLDMVPALAAGLAQIAPTYYVTGNHEWAVGEVRALKRMLTENGVTPLTNEYTVLEKDGRTLVLAGIDDLNGPADQKTLAELMVEIRGQFGDAFTVLLSHRNTRLEEYDRSGADLVISGHGHGGMVRLPFTDGLIGPGRTWFPSHTAGLYPLPGGGQLMVSRGLGTGQDGFRLFNRPHLPVIVLRFLELNAH